MIVSINLHLRSSAVHAVAREDSEQGRWVTIENGDDNVTLHFAEDPEAAVRQADALIAAVVELRRRAILAAGRAETQISASQAFRISRGAREARSHLLRGTTPAHEHTDDVFVAGCVRCEYDNLLGDRQA